MVMLSVHTGGVEKGVPALDVIADAAQPAVDYVHLVIHRTHDGVYVVNHDAMVDIPLLAPQGIEDGKDVDLDSIPYPCTWVVRGHARKRIEDISYAELTEADLELPTYCDALKLLRDLRVKAHLDFTFSSPDYLYREYLGEETYEVAATREAIEVLGVDSIVISSTSDRTVQVLRDWAERQYPELLVGLSLGRDTTGMHWQDTLCTRVPELFPSRRFNRTGANFVVVKHTMARWVRRFAHKNGFPMLVWTVDDIDDLSYWLQDSHGAWLVTTNRVGAASELQQVLDPRRAHFTDTKEFEDHMKRIANDEFAIKGNERSYREERDERNTKRTRRNQVMMGIIGGIILLTMIASTVATAFQ